MTVGQSQNIGIKILTFALSILISLIFLPFIIIIGLIFHYVGNALIWVIERVNYFKLYVLEKYVLITNMPLNGKRILKNKNLIYKTSFDLKMSDNIIHFPEVAAMSDEERKHFWVEVLVCDRTILKVPCEKLSREGGFAINWAFPEGINITAYLIHESIVQ